MSIFNFKETAKANFQSCCTWRLFPLSWPKFHSDFSNRCYRKTRADFLANTMYLLCVFHSVSNFLVVLMLYCFLLLLSGCPLGQDLHSSDAWNLWLFHLEMGESIQFKLRKIRGQSELRAKVQQYSKFTNNATESLFLN